MVRPIDNLKNFQITQPADSTKTAKTGKTPQGLTVKQASKAVGGNKITNLFKRLQLYFGVGQKKDWYNEQTIVHKLYDLPDAQFDELKTLFDEAGKDITDKKVQKFQKTVFSYVLRVRTVEKFTSNFSDSYQRAVLRGAIYDKILDSSELSDKFYGRIVALMQAGINCSEFLQLTSGEKMSAEPSDSKIDSFVAWLCYITDDEEFDKIIEDHAKAKAAQ